MTAVTQTSSASAPELTAQEVARFLQQQPDFFSQHAEVFAALEVPHPHQSRAISLGERQIMTLRERVRDLEWRLAELSHNATANETISRRLAGWCARMLAEREPALVPGAVAMGLAEHFELQEVALRVWSLKGLGQDGYGAPVSDDVRTFADSLRTPYCGNDTEFEAAAWLGAKPASLAIVALRLQEDAPACGLLVLGSDDAARFAPGMGTAFLEQIGRLAGAALSRLDPAG